MRHDWGDIATMGQPQIRMGLKRVSHPSNVAVLIASTLLLLFATSSTVEAARQTSKGNPQAGTSSRQITNLRSVREKPGKSLPLPVIALGINKSVPSLEPGVECPLSQVVTGVGRRMTELVENLQKFDATEHLEHFNVGASGSHGKPETRKFDYVAIITLSQDGGFRIEEYRNGSVDKFQFPANIATTGLPTLALLFHPNQVSDFNITCEGLGKWDSHPAWLVDFAQRPDRPNRLSGYVINNRNYPVPLKGRVWIDVDSYQVRRLESEMMKPIPEIKLAEQDFAIDYGPVQFRTNGQPLWLPLDAAVYSYQGKHRFYRRHTFSNFKVFGVETAQQIQTPKESYCFKNTSHRDIAGVLSVSPISRSSENIVSVNFTIPSGKRLCKIIGPGKDVSMPVEEVGSAIFRYNGLAGSITEDSILPNESTLELIPEFRQ